VIAVVQRISDTGLRSGSRRDMVKNFQSFSCIPSKSRS